MMLTLVRKLLRDVRLPLLILIILMAAFQCLWIKVAQRISGETGLLRQLVWLGEGRGVTPGEIEKEIKEINEFLPEMEAKVIHAVLLSRIFRHPCSFHSKIFLEP